MKLISCMLATLKNRVPFFEVVVLVSLMLTIKEEFPFSHFPLYSGLGEQAEVLYVTNEQGTLLPFEKTFNFSAARSRKFYYKEIKKNADSKNTDLSKQSNQIAGTALLQFLTQNAPPLSRQAIVNQVLTLHVETLRFTDGILQKNVLPPVSITVSQ
jgi:hypothetical protein